MTQSRTKKRNRKRPHAGRVRASGTRRTPNVRARARLRSLGPMPASRCAGWPTNLASYNGRYCGVVTVLYKEAFPPRRTREIARPGRRSTAARAGASAALDMATGGMHERRGSARTGASSTPGSDCLGREIWRWTYAWTIPCLRTRAEPYGSVRQRIGAQGRARPAAPATHAPLQHAYWRLGGCMVQARPPTGIQGAGGRRRGGVLVPSLRCDALLPDRSEQG